MMSSFRNMLQRRDLLMELVRSDLRQRDADTALGPIWWLIDPLILMLMYWMLVLVLGRGGGREAFPVFLLCGLLTAKYLTGSVATSASILFRRRGMIQAYPFPTALLPVATVLINLIFFVIAVLVLMVVSVPFFGRSLDWSFIQLPLMLVPFTMLTLGASMIAAGLGATIRDLTNVIQYGARLLTYASPVIYGPERIGQALEEWSRGGWLGEGLFVLYQSNPLAIAIEIVRGSVYEPGWVAWQWWLVLGVESVLMLALGVWWYHRIEKRVVKFL